MGVVEMRSMMLPLTSTLDGAESAPPLPSKIRTFWNSVAPAFVGGLPCAQAAEASPTAINGSATTRIRRDMEIMGIPTEQKAQHSACMQPLPGHQLRMPDAFD